jgi:hypothetical protein
MKNGQVVQIDGDRNGGASAGKQDTGILFKRIAHLMQLALICIHEKKNGYFCVSSGHAGSTIRTFTHSNGGDWVVLRIAPGARLLIEGVRYPGLNFWFAR